MARPNFVLITADDMNWDAVGAFGCLTAGTTPHIDRLAAEGLRFKHGHVTIAVCQPSRSALMTGRYPHLSGGEGFYRLRYKDVPILPAILRTEGYDVGILGAEYYNSVRRCDDTVGRLLDVLDEAGAAENTLVMFLSDNGMAFPFAKTNCYLNSTRTPWVVRWPAVVQAGCVDAKHFIAGIDYLPTVLDAIGADVPDGVNGKSLLPVLRGEAQAGCEQVFTQFHQTSAWRNYPMRCVQNARFGYIFNPWSDGERAFRNESQNGRSWQAMEEAAACDPALAARNHLFTYRVLEEFYDFEHDPNALHNLIDDPNYADEIQGLRNALEEWMVETGDPALEAFRGRASQQALDELMDHLADAIGKRVDE